MFSPPRQRWHRNSLHLGELGPQAKLEIQYALQCRHDERHGKIQPPVVQRVVNLLLRAGSVSLTEFPEPSWRESVHAELKDPMARAFLAYAIRKIVDLGEDDGWESEYPRDVW